MCRCVYRMYLHDPHTTPEPFLVLSGTTYLIPAYMAYKGGYNYVAFSNLFLASTTIGFHGTRNDYIFALDCIAILNYILCGADLCSKTTAFSRNAYMLSTLYSLVSYFVGQRFSILSFDPDWNRQMFFHSLMHISSSYAAYSFITDLNNRPHPSADYHSLTPRPSHPLQSYHH